MRPDGPSLSPSEDETPDAELLQRLRELEARVEQLEQERDALRAELQDECEARKEAIKNEQIERTRIVQKAKDEVRSELKECRAELLEEQKTRTRANSKLAKRVTALENESGIDTAAADGVGEKLERLVRNGPSDVTDRVYPVHERAQTLLEHAAEWGDLVHDKNGRRVIFIAPGVKPYLNAQFERKFSTSEIERIFDKVVDIARDSDRRVRKDKNGDRNHRLIVWANSEKDSIVR